MVQSNDKTIPSAKLVNSCLTSLGENLEQQIKDKVVGLLNWQGVKDTEAAIKAIASAKKGDVYHANDKGSEWVCTEDIFTADHSVWEELGTPIDLSGYYTKDEVNGKVKPLADSIGADSDVASANGSLYAQIKKNANVIGSVKQLEIQNRQTISSLSTSLNGHEKRLSDVEDLVHRGLPVYGVEWDVNQSSPDVTRIGIPELHRTLPCHQLRGCLLADNGTVNEYLPQNDWTSATRDGSKGQVMVEIPEMWMKFEIDGDMRRVLLSPVAIGGFKHYQKRYVSAYEATVQRSTNKLASVVNTTEDYRGGLNDANLDGTANSMLGKPASGLMKDTYRTYARNRYPNAAWNMYVYDVHCQLTWLFVVEYATLDSQKAFNAELTADGYHQGGLGEGLTNLTSSDLYEMRSSPIAKCGYTDELGNNTGEKVLPLTFTTGEKNVSVCRYRGIENIIGNVSAIADGIWAQSNGAIFIKTEPTRFSPTRPTNSELTCWRRSEAGFIQNIDESAFTNGWAIPKAIGSNTIYRDYNAFNNDSGDLCVYLGGGAGTKSQAGLFLFASMSTTRTDVTIGTRLCYLPQEDNSGTLRDLYISAGAKYNEATGYYELNGLTDITEEEMRVIWQEDLSGWYRKGRTNLTRNIAYKGNDGGYSSGQKMSNICNGNVNLEVFNLGSDFYASCSFVAFQGCLKLREVSPQYKITPYTESLGYNSFSNCPALQEVRFNMQYVTSGRVLFPESPLLSKESVLSIITTMGSVPKENPFTITLHPTAYARLKDDADIVAALETKGGIVTLVSA